MAFNGSGTFNPTGLPVVTGTTISSTTYNNTIIDIGNGLTNTITRDGQSPPTADIPMGGHKLVNLANGTVSTDAAAYGQIGTAVSNEAALLAASSGSSLVGFIQSGTGAVATTSQAKMREIHSIGDFLPNNYVIDGSVDYTTQIQSAFTWLSGAWYRQLVGVTAVFQLTNTITAGGQYAEFDGNCCGFKNAIASATPNVPLFLITTATLFSFGNFTTSVDAASGKGHCIAIIGSGATPSAIVLKDIGINYSVGSGKDYSNASMNACGVYAYGIQTLKMEYVYIQNCTNGTYLDNIDKVLISNCVNDDCTNQGIYLNNIRDIVIDNETTINGCGQSGQGALEFNSVTSLRFTNNRIKGGSGSQILSSGSSNTQRRVSIRDNHFEVYSNTDDSIKLRTNCVALVVDGNDLQYVPYGTNAYTAAINIVDTPGVIGYGGRITSNNIRVGSICALTDGIKLSSSTNPTRGFIIESNTIGSISSSDVGGASSITNAINLSGTGAENKIRSNIISAYSTQTITNGIVVSNNQTNTELDGNRFDGTVTNQIVDNGISTLRYDTGSWTPIIKGDGTAGTGTYTLQAGRYIRDGVKCFVMFTLTWTAHTGTGNMRLDSLPFTIKNTTNCYPMFTIQADSLTYTTTVALQGGLGSTQLLFTYFASGGALTVLALDTAASIYGSGWFEVA